MCGEQECCTPLCPWHHLHVPALCASHKVYMGRCCPTLFKPARCALSGKWVGSCCWSMGGFATPAPTPLHSGGDL